MSNEVIALKVDTLVNEVKLLRTELVRRDVYEEQRRADGLELAALRAEQASLRAELQQAGQRRWAVWLAVVAAGIALGKDLLAAFLVT